MLKVEISRIVEKVYLFFVEKQGNTLAVKTQKKPFRVVRNGFFGIFWNIGFYGFLELGFYRFKDVIGFRRADIKLKHLLY